MGSDKKRKSRGEHKRGDSISPSASDEDERKIRKRDRKVVEQGEKKNRNKDKGNHGESSRHRTHKEKKSKHKHSRKHHQKQLNFEEISKDDYFSKNNEFATWLKEEKDMFFSDLSSESARGLFTEFVDDWNHGKLDSQYYEGISSGPRTAHNWKIRQ